ncbi:MAG: SH3 domain-containing protein [Planctomycetes bacterium]|nr:SH3 domain-containing protein [Planctomycetota bacterium]
MRTYMGTAAAAMLTCCLACGAAEVPPGAGTEGGTPAQKRLVEKANGKVNAARVNIRSGPGTEYSIIVTVDKDTELEVFAYRTDWYQVGLPAGAGCWVYKNYVKVDLPEGEIDPAKAPVGVITGSNVRLRAVPDMMMSNVLGELSKGQSVTITGKRGDWYRVRPPEGTSGWMSAEYVDLPEGVRVKGEPLPGETTRAVIDTGGLLDEPLPAGHVENGEIPAPDGGEDLPRLGTLAEAEHLMAEELKKPPLERDFSKAIELYNRVLTSGADEEKKKAAKARLRQIFTLTPRRELAAYMKDMSRRIEEELEKTEKRYEAKIEALRSRLPRSRYTARGILYPAKGMGRDVRYWLKMGEIPVYLLKVKNGRQDSLLGKEVGVIGEILPPQPGYDAEVINVTTMEPTR